MKSIKSVFVIYNIEGFDCEGESKKIVATRILDEESIKKEVSHLNKNINSVIMPSENLSNFNYFDYEMLDIQEENKYNKNFTFSSTKDENLNKAGLKESLIHNFDRNYEQYSKSEYINKNKTLKEYLEEQFSEFLSGNFYFCDLIEIAKNLKELGILKSNISVLFFETTNENIESVLSKKFKVNKK